MIFMNQRALSQLIRVLTVAFALPYASASIFAMEADQAINQCSKQAVRLETLPGEMVAAILFSINPRERIFAAIALKRTCNNLYRKLDKLGGGLLNGMIAAAQTESNLLGAQLIDALRATILDEEVVKDLVAQGANLNLRDHREPWCTSSVIPHPPWQKLRALVLVGSSFGLTRCERERTLSYTNDSALMLAARAGRQDLVQILLEKGANPNQSNTEGPVLAYACKNGHLSIAQLLLECGADVALPDAHYCTPLGWAITKGNSELVSLLLAHDADPHALAGYAVKDPNEAHLIALLLGSDPEGIKTGLELAQGQNAAIQAIVQRAAQEKDSAQDQQSCVLL